MNINIFFKDVSFPASEHKQPESDFANFHVINYLLQVN